MHLSYIFSTHCSVKIRKIKNRGDIWNSRWILFYPVSFNVSYSNNFNMYRCCFYFFFFFYYFDVILNVQTLHYFKCIRYDNLNLKITNLDEFMWACHLLIGSIDRFEVFNCLFGLFLFSVPTIQNLLNRLIVYRRRCIGYRYPDIINLRKHYMKNITSTINMSNGWHLQDTIKVIKAMR